MLDEKLVLVDDHRKPLEMKVNKSTSIPSTSNVASKKVMDKFSKNIRENACKLELPAYMELYSEVNVDKLKYFEPSMRNDELGESLPSIDDLVTEKDAVLADDTIIEHNTSFTRHGERKSYRIGRKGQRLSASKWFSKEVGEAQFPHLQF
ncbi:hypothetical protein Tco_1273375 [Tanacetum coccineum]